jgi:hypothetical protein
MPFFKQFYTNTMALRKELNIIQSKYHSNLFIFIFFHFGINPANYTASHKLIDNKLKSNMYPFPKDGYMLYKHIIDSKNVLLYDFLKNNKENLTNFNFTGEITGLKHLELYLSNPREDDVLRLINMLNPNINVNIRCYENGPLNEKNMFSYSRLMRELQNKIIHIFKDKNIPFKAYC